MTNSSFTNSRKQLDKIKSLPLMKWLFVSAFMLTGFLGSAQNPITTNPVDEEGCTRGGWVATWAINSVTPPSGATVVYQWEADTGAGFVVVPSGGSFGFGGTAGPVLTLSNPDGCSPFQKDGMKVRCRVFITGGTGGTWTSNSADLILHPPVDFTDFVIKSGTYTSNVPNDTVCEEGSTEFEITNVATADTCVSLKVVTYQWQYKPASGSWADVPASNPTANLAKLQLTNLPLSADQTQYRCEIQSKSCTPAFYSDTVTLVVDPRPYAGFDTTNIYVCEGDSFTIDINIWNSALSANRGSLPTGWELYFDTSLMGGYASLFDNAPLDSITGVGNGSPALQIGHSGISTHGVYTLKLDSIVNDSAALRCLRALGDVITINVYPRPNATFVSSSPRAICEEDSACFQVEVTNAVFNGSGVDWVMYVTDPYGTISGSGVYTGNGNSTLTFCTSLGLLTDSFRITIDSIRLGGVAAQLVGDSCLGTVGPQDSIDFLILPKPFAALGEYSALFKVTANGDPATGPIVPGFPFYWTPEFWGGVSPSDSAGAHYFDWTPDFDMRLDSIAIQISKPTVGTEDINIWVRNGSYVGNEFSSTGWTLMNTVTLPAAAIDTPMLLSTMLPTGGFDATGGQTYGIYIEADQDGALGTRTVIHHWPGTFKSQYIGPFITTTTGRMGIRDFIDGDTNEGYLPDVWAKGLQLQYRGGLVVSGDTVRVCQGDSFIFDISVSNVNYEGIPLNWELTFTDPTGTMNYSSPLTGTGDSAFFDRIYTSALTPGTYTFSLTSIKLTPTSGAPIPPDCIHIIDDEFFTFEVVPKINAQFNKDTFNLCLGSGDVFDIEITNALFDGQNVDWELFYTDPSNILPSGANTGSGNSTPSYTVPNTLPIGQYVIYLDSIKTVGTNPICKGITGPLDTIVINVLPYPTASLEAKWLHGPGVTVTNDTLRICQYDSVELKITVDDAEWLGNDLFWTLAMIDGTGTLINPQTGYGDSVILDTTSASLAPGRYIIDLIDVKLDTLGLTCTNTLDSNRIVLEIYSRPRAQFSTDTIEICQDDTGSYDVIISAALFEGAPFDWSLHYTDTSGLIWTGSPLMSSGNQSPTFGIPSTLPVGQYQIVLDSIVKDFDPHCMGILEAPDTLIINVRPKPMVTLTPNIDTVCEGITTTYTIEVSNTHWFGGDSVNWRLDLQDGLGSTLGISPLTGYGDTVATYTTSAILPVGTHMLVLQSITNTSDTCTRFLNDTLKVTVNFLPQLTVLDVMDPICDGDSLMVSFRVDSMNPGDAWMFSYVVDPNTNGNLSGTVSGSADGSGSYTGMFTVADTLGYGPFSRLLNFGPVTNNTTGCVEIDSVPDSTFYVHPLPAVDITNIPTVCSGQFDPLTGDPVTGWEDYAQFDANISGTTVGSLNKGWTFYYHTEDTVSGYVSTTHTMSGTGDNGGAPYTLNVPDSLFYYFNANGSERGFKLVVDSIKITAGLALCNDLTQQDVEIFTVNTNPLFEWVVPDSICLGTPIEWDIISSGLKGSDDWRVGFAWDTTAYDATPYFGPRDFDETGSDTFNVTFPNTAYPIYATMYYLWSDTLVNKSTGCYYKPEKLDSFRVDPPTVADSLFGNTTVCEDDNSGYLYMEGHVGHILYWQASYDEGFTWDTVRTAGNFPENKPVVFSSLLDTMWYTDKTFKTRYRVWVKSGACDKDVSNVAHVYVNPRPMAAIVDLDDFICTGDSAKLRVNVTNVPTSNDWTVYYTTTSPAGSGSFSGTGSGIATHFINSLTGTPSFVTIDSIYNTTTTCHNDMLTTDVYDSVYVYPFTSAGTLASSDTVCRDLNSGTLSLTGFTGAVVKWQFKENGGSWTDIGNTGSTYNYVNLDITTDYRVIVQNGTCDADTSNTVTITIMSLPHASITGSDTICPGNTLGLTVAVDSSYGGAWAIDYLEGSVSKTLTGTGDGNFTLTTGSIFNTTDVTLQKIYVTAPVMNYAACMNTQIDNPGTATVTILDQATASINSGPDSICTGSDATVGVIVSNILASDSVKVDWSINSVAQTAHVFKGPGNHSFTVPSSDILATGGASTDYSIRLDVVTNLSSTEPCAGLVSDSIVVRVDTNTVGGTTAGAANVCLDNNSGIITLSGNLGDVIYWESSEDGSSWTQVNETSDTLTYSNLTDTTQFRAVVKNGACGMEYSSATTVTTYELWATISGGDTICSGTTDDLTINIENAGVATWYIALLEGSRPDTISGTGSSYTYTTGNLQSTSDVTLQSIWTGTKSASDCYNTLNNVATSTVTVLDRPYATIASGPSRLCEGSTFTFTVNVSSVPTGDSWVLTYDHDGSTGTLTGSGSGTFTASSVVNTSALADTITLVNISATSGSVSCDSSLSQEWIIAVDENTIGGTTAGATSVCNGANNGTVTLSGELGSVLYWEASEDQTSWLQVNNYTDTLTYSNLTDTTFYRAVVKNGECDTAYSTVTEISVYELAATISGGDTICSGLTDDLTINIENTGASTWYIALLEGSRYDTISGTGSTYTYTTGNIQSTTDVTLQAVWTGTMSTPDCFKSLNNLSTATVTVLDRPYATIASGPSRLCEGSGFTFTVTVSSVPTGDAWTLTYDQDGSTGTLSGTGSGTFTASSLKNVTALGDTITLTNISATSGTVSCDSSLSEDWIIAVDEPTIGGTTSGTDLVCNGNNTGVIYLAGERGDVIGWESSTNNSTWTQINNYIDSLIYNNLTDTTYFRAVVKNGECSVEYSSATVINVKEDPIATISGGDTICSGMTDDLTINIENTYGSTWYIALLEGSRTDTISGTASTYTFTTSNLSSTSDIVLQSIWTGTKSAPDCYNSLNNVSTSTVTVLPRPYATISSGPSRLCEGSTFTFAVSVNSVPTGDSWVLTYEQDGTTGTLSGTGSGTFTASSLKGVSPTTELITLKSITATMGSKSCDSTLSDTWTINVDPTTVAGVIGDNDTVCMGGSGAATQTTPGTGLIVKWQSKIGAAGTWIDINNTTTSNPYYNVRDTTYIRAIYQSGLCDTKPSNMVVVVPKPIPTASIRTTTADDTVCAGNTADFEIVVSNVEPGQTFSVSYLEGSTLKTSPTLTQTASGVHTFTTAQLASGTTIEIRSISARLTAGGLTCGQNLSGAITIEVLPNPNATITSYDGRLCEGSTTTIVFNVSDVPTNDTWSLVYSQDGNDSTITGTGSGSVTITTTRTVTASSEVIELKKITNTSNAEMCETSLSTTRTIIVDETTVGGTTSGGASVCKGSNDGEVELTGQTGSVIYWESSEDRNSWTQLNNYTTILKYANLNDTTYYRAVVKNGECDTAYSSVTEISVYELAAAITGGDTICSGLTDDLTISIENTGSKTWYIALLEGTRYDTISGTGSSYTYTTGNLQSTSDVTLQAIWTGTQSSPDCFKSLNNQATATVTVLDRPFATIASGPSRLCEGSDFTFTVTVSSVPTGDAWTLTYDHDGSTGTVSGTGSGTFTASSLKGASPLADTITLVNISATSGNFTCDSSLTEDWTIVVDETTVAGTIGFDTTVCYGGSGSMVQTAPGVGSIVDWEYRVKGAATWVSVGNSSTTLNFSSLTDTTEYRAVYKNGVCDVAYSNEVMATPKPLPTATIATQAATDTICSGETATLSVTVNNIDAGDSAWIMYTEGSVTKYIGYRLTSSPQTFDLNTGTLTTTTDVELQTIKNVDPLTGQPMCSNDLSNVAKATITVIDLPDASIVQGPDTLCQGDEITFTVNVANVKKQDTWRLLYTLEGDIDTLFGTGPTTLTTTDFDPNTAQSAIISLTEILNTSNLGRCKSEDMDDWTIYIYKPTVAGTIEAADTICKGGSTSLNEVSGTTKEGRIVEWEYKPSSSGAWTTVANSSTTLDIMNLLETTSYRAIYKNGVCDTMRSNVITVEIRELPVVTISGSTTICAGLSTDLTVTVSNVGSTQNWEIDYLEGTSSKQLTGTGSGTFTLTVSGIITNTDVTLDEIRTVSGTPQCSNDQLDNKATATVLVNQRPYASLNSVNSPICETEDVTFDITVGNVRSNENWTVTYNIDNTASGLTYSGKGPGTFTVNYDTIAAVNPVQDSYTVELTRIVNTTTTCDSSLSSSAALLIDAVSAPGTMLNGATVCYGDNNGTVTYFGGNGEVVNWESSTNGGSSWSSIVNSDTFHTYNDLTDTTWFRVVMQNGQCATAAATPISINVRPLPTVMISGSDTVCAGEPGVLTVSALNTYGENWQVSYLAGTITDTLSVSGPLTTGVITTSTLVSNTDVTLKKVWMTSGSPQCMNDDLNNNATATVEVNELPAVTINTLEDSVCTGSTASGKLVIDNVRSNEDWRVYWSINGGGLDSLEGTGAGSFNFTTNALTVDPSVVRLTDIRNLTTSCRYLPTDEDSVRVSPATNGGTLRGLDTVCYNDNSGTLTLGADAIGDVVRWEYSTDGGTTWTTIRNTSDTYSYTDLMKTTTFRVLVQSGVCSEEYSSTVQVVVRPVPMAAITSVGANSLCEGSSTFVVYTVSNVMASQSWTIKYLEGSTTKTVSGTGSVTDTIFTSNLVETTDLTLQTIVINAGAPLCSNMNLTNNQTTTITVIPDVDASIVDYPTDVCVGTNPQVTVMVADIKSSEGWTLLYRVNNGSTQSTNGIGPGKYSFNIGSLNNVGANGVRLVSITNTGSSPNCTAALTDSITINVDATSLGGTISGVDTVCYNEGGTLTVNNIRGTVQKWQYSTDGVNFSDIANTGVSHTFTNLVRRTWFRVEVKNGACDAVLSIAKMVDVQALPTVSITNPTQDICSGSSTSIGVTVGNVPTNSSWTISYTENGSAQTYSGTGTSGTINLGPYSKTTQIVLTNIEVTNGLGCENSLSESATITVIPNPTATIDSAPDSLCEDDLISFKVSVDDVATGVSWELDYTIDGVAGATVTGSGSGIFTVNSLRAASPTSAVIVLTSIELVPSPGCRTILSDRHTINVSPTTVPGTLAANSTTVCYGGSATLTLSGNVGDVKNWEYSTDGGNTWTVTSNSSTTLSVTNLTQTTVYRVYVQSGPCSGAYSNTVTVTVIPEPVATVTSNAKVCPGDAATFTLLVTNVGATDAWSVIYTRNGVTSGTPVTGTGPGNFDFTVAGSAYMGNPTLITVDLVSIENTTYGCINANLASTASARVTPNPVAAFSAENQCEDTVVSFVNNSSIPEGTITNYKWYFGDGDSSSTPDPTHTYAAAGTYNVRLVAYSDNGCQGEVTQSVTIYDNPVADFTFNNVCQNAIFSATDASTVANGNIVSWFWTLGDGTTSTDQNPTHNYSTSGNYDVTLTVTTNNGCTHTVSKEVTIYILPEANFVAEPVCEDDAMQFVNTSAIGYGTMTYDWSFDGQGTSSQKDPSFTFTGFGDFNVELVAISNNGCRDTINRNVTVHPNPTAAFTVDPVCIGETNEFVNGSSVPTGSIVEYFWDFADASFSGLENPTHTYAQPGTYSVNLRVKTDKGCIDSVSADAIVIALPDVELVPNDSQHIGGCDSIQLSANANARTWDWTRNGDTIATGTNTVFASVTGTYKVRISVSTLGVVCFNSDSVHVLVEPIPVVNAWPRDKITQNIDTISKGQSIDLNASATGYQLNESSFVWDPSGPDFLAGLNTGTTVTTSQLLEDDQVFTVTVTDGFGCTASADVTVIVLDDFNLYPYNLITPNGDGMNDNWVVENIWAYPEANVVIFNRYGMVVYEGNNYIDNPWDGTNQSNGNDLPDGAYYYVITHPDHPDTVYKGAINLIRNRDN